MARYHRTRARPFHILNTRDTQLPVTDREDSGVQLDEPCSPVARQQENEELVTMRHGVTITKIPKHKSLEIPKYKTSETNSMVRSSHQCKMASDTNGCGHTERSSKADVTSLARDTKSLNLCKGNEVSKNSMCNNRNSVNDNKNGQANSSRITKVNATLNLEEDEGLDIRGSNSDLNKGEYSYTDSVTNDTDSTEQSSDAETDSHPRFSLTGESLSCESEKTPKDNKQKTVKQPKDKDSKKRKFRKLLPALRRSQSVGCESELVPDHALFLETCPGVQETNKESSTDTSEGFRRLIHKTCSADAAMMANEVLPLDPQELVRNKQKSSIARNMRKKLQKLKRRNTDSLLGAAILSVRGSHKITQADALEWGSSFDSLLSDKSGIEMFRSFLKSEFSEENIEFWIECEEFKTIRTNKLATQAHRIYSDFIAIKAPKQVNLDSKTRLDTVTCLENPTRDMFKQAQKRIQYLMENDSYKRFLEMDTCYLNLLGKHSLTETKR